MSIYFTPVLTPEHISTSPHTKAVRISGSTPNIELPTDRAAATHTSATRYGPGSRNGPQGVTVHAGSGANEATDPSIRATHRVNEALRGGLFGDLDNIGEEWAKNTGNADEDAGWSSDGEPTFPSTSALNPAEQVIARTAYIMKQQLNMLPDIHAAPNQITPRDLVDSLHRPTFEQYANELEALVARVRGLLSNQPNTPSQHTPSIPLPPSLEKRQYRKNSRSFH